MSAVNAKTYAQAIDADVNLADDVSAAGTPHFFVNGRRLVGAQAFDTFKTVIDDELVKAEALVRAGVAPASVYETIIKSGKSAPEPSRMVVAASVLPAPFRGAANAKVVIQEFSDFQCPFCSRVEATIDQLLKDYAGKVKVVWRNLPLPFHQDAELAAQAAREAFVQKGNDGFTKMRELIFKHQGDPDGLKRPQLESYAAQAGLDPAALGKALDAGTHKAAIDADKKAASAAGISGTPAFVVGPYSLSGAQPLAKFKKLVDRVLAEPSVPIAAPGAAALKKN
jgi:protein-disulfide isomerase